MKKSSHFVSTTVLLLQCFNCEFQTLANFVSAYDIAKIRLQIPVYQYLYDNSTISPYCKVSNVSSIIKAEFELCTQAHCYSSSTVS